MKKTLVATIIGLAATVSVMAQGRVILDSYNSSTSAPYPTITYGANSGGTLNAAVASSANYTVGFYYATAGTANADGTGFAIPGAGWTLATGTGATALISPTGPGLFTTGTEFTLPNANATISIVIVAYNGADYASSLVRGHSAVITISPNTTAFGPGTSMGKDVAGGLQSGFQVIGVPEPSTFALAGLGLASLLIFRRRK